jgi:hypothetical protein
MVAFSQRLQPGELSLGSETPLGTLDNIKYNLRLRQQRGDGFGYLLDTEATWLLEHTAVRAQPSFEEINRARAVAFDEQAPRL